VLQKTREEEKKQIQQKQNNKINTKNKKHKSKKEPAQRAWKIRLYPTRQQREKLNQYFGIYRYTYNQCVAFTNEILQKYKDKKGKWKEEDKIKKQNLRKYFVNNQSPHLKDKPWIKELAYDSRDEAVQDFISAFKINKKKYYQSNKNHYFQMHFKSKKRKRQESFFIRERHWNQKTGKFAWLKQIKTKQPITQFNYDSRIIKDSIGRIFLIVLKPLEKVEKKNSDIRGDNQSSKWIISIDPGVPTFLTGYDPSGYVIQFCKNDISKIFRIAHYADKLQSIIYKHNIKHQRRYKLKRAFRKIHHTKKFET
jgi:hypothetical protein